VSDNPHNFREPTTEELRQGLGGDLTGLDNVFFVPSEKLPTWFLRVRTARVLAVRRSFLKRAVRGKSGGEYGPRWLGVTSSFEGLADVAAEELVKLRELFLLRSKQVPPALAAIYEELFPTVRAVLYRRINRDAYEAEAGERLKRKQREASAALRELKAYQQEYAQQPVRHRVEPLVRPAGAFPKPPAAAKR
jgi:hypothetical protein